MDFLNDYDDDENDSQVESQVDEENDSDDSFGPQPLEAPVEITDQKKKIKRKVVSKVKEVDPQVSMENFVQKYQIPIECEVSLMGHGRASTCVSIEPTGNRLVTGSLDYTLKLYDFGGMDSRLKAFQSIEAQEGHPILSISHSPSGDRFIVATTSAQPIVYDRDGKEVISFVKGDMYLHDLVHTKGHTMEVTMVQWHPSEKNIVVSSSLDGSVRVWDLLGNALFGKLISKYVLKIKPLVGSNRVAATACSFSKDGKKVIAGTAEGTIQIWRKQQKGDYLARPDTFWNYKECSGNTITSLAVSDDDKYLAVRYEHGVIAVWNLNQSMATTPHKVYQDLYNLYPNANIIFKPDSHLLLCCTSPKKEENIPANEVKSRLFVFDIDAIQSTPLLSIVVATGAIGISLKWQSTTNQIFCTLSTGQIKVLYDPKMSKKGVLMAVSRAPKREVDPTDFAIIGEIYAPLALPMYKTEPSTGNKKRKAELKDPNIAHIPEKPSNQGPGKRANTSFFFTNYVLNGHSVDNSRMQDPREALLKMDELTKKDPKFLGRAYQQSQPQNALHSKTFEEEQEEFLNKQKQIFNK